MSSAVTVDSEVITRIDDWHSQEVSEVLESLGTDVDSGLGQVQTPSMCRVVAVAVSAAVGEVLDAVAISVVLLVNGEAAKVFLRWRDSLGS